MKDFYKFISYITINLILIDLLIKCFIPTKPSNMTNINIKKHWQTLVLFSTNLYLLVLGIGWLIFHMNIRFFIERPSYILNEVKANLTITHYIIFTSFVLIHFVIIISVCYQLYRKKYPKERNTVVIYIMENISLVLDKLYWRPLTFLHDTIAPYIPYSARFFMYVESIWRTHKFTQLIVFAFDIFPKVFLAFIFVLEIVILGRVSLFFSCLLFLLIPLLLQIFLKVFKSFALRNAIKFLEPYITLKGVGEAQLDQDSVIIGYEYFEIILKPEYVAKESEFNHDENITISLQLEHICKLVDDTKNMLNNIYPYLTIIISITYLIGGFYRVIYLFL